MATTSSNKYDVVSSRIMGVMLYGAIAISLALFADLSITSLFGQVGSPVVTDLIVLMVTLGAMVAGWKRGVFKH